MASLFSMTRYCKIWNNNNNRKSPLDYLVMILKWNGKGWGPWSKCFFRSSWTRLFTVCSGYIWYTWHRLFYMILFFSISPFCTSQQCRSDQMTHDTQWPQSRPVVKVTRSFLGPFSSSSAFSSPLLLRPPHPRQLAGAALFRNGWQFQNWTSANLQERSMRSTFVFRGGLQVGEPHIPGRLELTIIVKLSGASWKCLSS